MNILLVTYEVRPQCDHHNGYGDIKVKGKAEHLYSTLHGIQTTLKRSGMDHTV